MKKITQPGQDRQAVIGWKEWLSLPDLGIPAIKAKIDTGARTSALHTFSMDTFTRDGLPMVRFGIHPLQKRRDIALFCEAPVVDRRRIKDSGGHSEMRYVIASSLVLGNMHWPIEITLTSRDAMMFRMLLGRTALKNNVMVDPARSYAAGRKLSRTYTAKTKKGDV
ncbi:MAG: ATP-dependent zinc protease [Desulfotignum sp.]|jgi:hypothetical protein|nr:ATP-dependent zinc protease [Desulfotignum sp.]